MDAVEDSAGICNVISKDLINLTLYICPNVHISENFPRKDDILLYYRKFKVMDKELTNDKELHAEEKTVYINLKKIGSDIFIPAPKEAVEASIPPAKRTALNRLRAKKQKHYLAKLSFSQQDVFDAELCAHVHKNPIAISDSYGPFLIRRRDGSVDIEYGLSLVPNTSANYKKQNTALKVLARATNDISLIEPRRYTAQPVDLLQAITRPPSNNYPKIKPVGLEISLLPYQCESVLWCLKREGKTLSNEHSVEDLNRSILEKVISPPLGWRKIEEYNLWVNPYLLKTKIGEPDCFSESQYETDSKGNLCYKGKGLLAEEMGLGKTIEIMSLVMLNTRPSYDHRTNFYDNSLGMITRSKATLVIVPQTILQQWKDEIEVHAPSLKHVVVGRHTKIDEIIDSDIVLISYNELSKWLPSAAFKGNMNRNSHLIDNDIVYRFSLGRVQFWRVVLDEVQMVNTGSTAAAHAAHNIPRIHAWAVSGTPVKKKLDDLRGITYFLSLYPFVEQPSWQRLISSSVDFNNTMRIIGLRHTKSMVSNQMTIPIQHRNLVMLKLSTVERIRYDRIYNEFKREAQSGSCNLSVWLNRLRQAYFIPFSANSTESMNSFENNYNDAYALSLDEVLTQLVSQADAQVWSETRELFNARLEYGQFLDKADRMPEALKLWHDVATEISNQISSVKLKLDELKTLEKEYKKRIDISGNAATEYTADDDDKEAKNDNVKTTKDREIEKNKGELTAILNRYKAMKLKLNTLQELLHRTYFFIGTGYFRTSQRLRLKCSDEDLESDDIKKAFQYNGQEETKYYHKAELLRGEILNDLENEVEALVLKAEKSKFSFTKINEFCSLPVTEAFDELSDFCLDVSTTLLSHMSTPLMEKQPSQSTEGIQLEDDYYSKTLELQENSFIYLDILQLLLRDRASAINGVLKSTALISKVGGDTEIGKQLAKKRYDIVERLQRCLNAQQSLIKIVRLSKGGSQTAEKLRSEIHATQQKYSVLQDLYNARVDYYKQLQDISDHVVDVKIDESNSIETLVQAKKLKIIHLEKKLEETVKNQVYLRNLVGSNHAKTQQKDDTRTNDLLNNCIICFDPIENGALAPCGHSFCEECLTSWLRTNNSCPLCKRRMNISDVHKFLSETVKNDVDTKQKESNVLHSKKEEITDDYSHSHQDETDKRLRELYHPISNSLYNKIHGIRITRLCGVKIDMIVRTVMYLRDQDPSAQIVIFSQWLTFLKVLYSAFLENKMKVASPSNLSTRSQPGLNDFRENQEISCLLLHAKTDVAGLTLVNANHVFLCEPLINTALELQAISRINRIGQQRETYVWQFCVEDTVEQSILGTTTRERMLQTVTMGNIEISDSNTLANALPHSMINKSSGAEIITDDHLLKQVLFKNGDIPNQEM